jgi:membrane-bound lytic murein transglycosylase A
LVVVTLTPLRLSAFALLVAGLIAAAYIAGTRRGAPKPPPSEPALAGVSFSPRDFAALPGWRDHDPSLALAAFARLCALRADAADEAAANPHEALMRDDASLGGTVADWRAACAAAPATGAGAETARAFFETHFTPVSLAARLTPGGAPEGRATIEPKGRFTSYFEPAYPASDQQTEEFSAPVLARPADLVTVDLSAFREDLAGDRIAGSVVDGALTPYPDHAAINAGALKGRTEAIAYMRPTDLLFLQIQGSGRLLLPEGTLRIGYDGHNGHPYTPVGRTLIDEGALTRETVSMQTIRSWLEAAPPAKAARVRESNRSYIFFRRLDDLPDPALGPLGAAGAQLTPMVSLAVDPRFTPLGAPVFVDIEGVEGGEPIRRLMIAEDRGGAIKGPVRGDLYAGSGDAAGAFAGAFNRMGTMTVLVPKSIAARLPADDAP